MSEPQPMRVHSTQVAPGWIDYNGHMTEGAYGMVFADAGDATLLQLGFDDHYRNTERGTFFTVENHTRFLRDVPGGRTLTIDTLLLGVDAKRLHLFHTMYDGEVEVATQEAMLLHVDFDTTRVRPMSAALLERAEVLAAAQAALPRPAAVGAPVRSVSGKTQI